MSKNKCLNNVLRRILLLIIFGALGIIYYLQNTIIPFFSDDIWHVKGLQTFHSIYDKIDYLLNFAWAFWNNENGRIINHVFLRALCISGDVYFDVFNALLLVSTVILIVKLSVPSNRDFSFLSVLLVLLFLFYLVPDSSTVFYWAAGSLNYLFSIFLTSFFLLLLRLIDSNDEIPAFVYPFILLFAFSSGWIHEIFSIPVSFALFVLLIERKFKMKRTLLFPILFYWVGTVLVIVSPGTIHRIVSTQGMVESVSFVNNLLSKFLQSFKIFRYGRFFYIVFVIILYYLFVDMVRFKKFIKEYQFLLICIVANVFIVVLLGVGGRAICGVEFFSLLIIAKYFSKQTEKSKFYEYFSYIAVFVILIHQIYLIPYMKESWKTYKDAVVELGNSVGEIKTIGMEDWKSSNILVDPFVAHPYKLMREDLWMRKPLNCEVCRKDVYEILKSYSEDTKFGVIGDDYILPYSETLLVAIKNNNLFMKLEPISADFEGGVLFVLWHSFLQRMFSSRYPSEIMVSGDNVTVLCVGEHKYLRFESTYVPIPRKVLSVFVK